MLHQRTQKHGEAGQLLRSGAVPLLTYYSCVLDGKGPKGKRGGQKSEIAVVWIQTHDAIVRVPEAAA
jgi:hypothetical protein